MPVSMNPRQHVLRILAIVGLTLGLLGSGLSAAAAGPGQDTAVAVAHHRSTSADRIPAITDAEGLTITCTLSIDYPHESHHFPDTVNVEARWSCDAPVASLSMAIGLYFEGAPVRRTTFSNVLQPSLDGNAAFPCVRGNWQGRAVGTVVFPPAFDPPSATVNVVSPILPITCT